MSQGFHYGEDDQIKAEVIYKDPYGHTTTDYRGIYYHVYGRVFHEPKIYPSWTYGKKYPLYFMGLPMRFEVHLTNTMRKGGKKFRLRIQAVNYVMETSGFAGQIIAPGQEWIVESLLPGETKVVHGEILIPTADLPSGLDVTKIRIFHLNNGKNQSAGFIKEETAVWCPPKYR